MWYCLKRKIYYNGKINIVEEIQQRIKNAYEIIRGQQDVISDACKESVLITAHAETAFRNKKVLLTVFLDIKSLILFRIDRPRVRKIDCPKDSLYDQRTIKNTSISGECRMVRVAREYHGLLADQDADV